MYSVDLTRYSQRGFSLVELGIVIVIIGLITGSVLVGQTLIRGSELQQIYSDVQKYKSGMNNFLDIYGSLPGDMQDATTYWGPLDTAGDSDGLGVDCTALASPSTPTCNGNGDGLIASVGGFEYEQWRFWHHLSNAELIEGGFAGNASPTTTGMEPNYNVPEPAIAGGTGFSVVYQGPAGAGDTQYFQGVYGNILHLSGQVGGAIDFPVLTAEEARDIDIKGDDGFPATGNVRAFEDGFANTPDCTNGTSQAADYDLTQAGPVCALVFITGL